MIVIKKYENRRLYDTSKSRYINLEDVADMIRSGEEIQVIDSRSGDDITHSIFAQIIVESAREEDSPLPTDLLRQLIMASGKAQRRLLRKYIRFASKLYDKSQQDFRERTSASRVKPKSPVELIQRFLHDNFDGAKFEWHFGNDEDEATEAEWDEDEAMDAEWEEAEEEIDKETEEDASEALAELRRRIEELEGKLSKPKKVKID